MDPKMIDMLLASAKEAYAMGGWLGLAAVGLVAVVNLYQVPAIQDRLPGRLKWQAWPVWGRILFVFLGSALGAFLTAMAGHVAAGAAAVSALGVGLAAVLGHRFVLAPLGRTDKAAAVAAAIEERLPTRLQALARMTSLVVPLDPEKVAEARALREATRVLR